MNPDPGQLTAPSVPPPTKSPCGGSSERRAFRRALLCWFDAHQRVLPWRADRDPYRVWVSEIMLQQTRVAAVLEPYRHFLENFPTVTALADARLSRVLALWSGLGYYRRARMLHAAARQIVSQWNARFPGDAAGWQSLPGVGRYTAAAIASICYGERCAVVDGNVRRVLNRLLGMNGRQRQNRKGFLMLSAGETWQLAGELLSTRRPGDFNQAMMELGATVCLPKSPACGQCPVRPWCRTVADGATSAGSQCAGQPGIPAESCIRPGPSGRTKTRLTSALITSAGRVWLVQRSRRESVMPGMWELPEANTARDGTHAGPTDKPALRIRHAIMNTDYMVHVFRIEWHGRTRPASAEGGNWFKGSQAAQLPLTGLARKILRQSGII